jgi:predicted lipid-binding transport protein (Tim44 family)
MKKFMMVMAALLSLGLLAQEADAKRLGGGSSVGRQRSTITQPPAKPPAQQAPSAAPVTPAQQPSGMSRWLGPLAGLAIGAGLASMFAGNGFGGAFGSILMMLLVVAAVVFAIRMLRSRRPAEPLRYAGAGAGTEPRVSSVPRVADISTGFGGGSAPSANRFPPGFDEAQFTHHAKLNFTQLQAANDRGDLSAMRDFMTPALYAEIANQLRARGNAPQQTDVVTLNAEVLEVLTEGNSYVATVRFSGMIREDGDGAATPFSELWHLEKPVNGKTGWVISGIQQN